jgi:hypothetical protein
LSLLEPLLLPKYIQTPSKAKASKELRQQLIDDAFEEQQGDRPFPDTKSRKRSSVVMTAGMGM